MLFRELTQSDIDFMKDHSVSRGILSKQPEVTDYNFTLEHEDKVLGIGGIRLINLTTAWGWIDMSDCAKDHIKACYRVIKEWMEILCEQKKLKRVQAYIETDFPEAIRMVEHLGFRRESTMEDFMGDRDAYMYKRIF